jgi:hypothetical protein
MTGADMLGLVETRLRVAARHDLEAIQIVVAAADGDVVLVFGVPHAIKLIDLIAEKVLDVVDQAEVGP